MYKMNKKLNLPDMQHVPSNGAGGGGGRPFVDLIYGVQNSFQIKSKN